MLHFSIFSTFFMLLRIQYSFSVEFLFDLLCIIVIVRHLLSKDFQMGYAFWILKQNYATGKRIMLQRITKNEHIEIIMVDICCGMVSIYAIHSCAPHLICHHPKEKIHESSKKILQLCIVDIKTLQEFYSVQNLCNFSIRTIFPTENWFQF